MLERPLVDVRPDLWRIVQGILQKQVPQHEVWAFGSRAKWTAKEFSDAAFRQIIERDRVVVQNAPVAPVGRVSPKGVTRQVPDKQAAVDAEDVGLRCANPTYEGEWRMVPIETLCLGIYDGPHATPKKTESGPIFLGISSLNNGQLDLSNTEHISEEDFAKWTRRVTPKAGDVVFSYETRLGQVAVIPPGLRCCLGRRMALMRVDPAKAIPDYLLYAYLSPDFQDVIRQRTIHGSTVDRIPLVEFGSFPIAVPPLAVQHEVVAVLRALDDRITLLRETNATLEAIAQALFKSWFVDFDPVRAKMEGRAPEGMDEATAALFPDGLEESELGMVPKGWRFVRLDTFIELAYGKALKAENRNSGNVPVYGSGGVTGWHNTALVNQPSIVVGRKGTVGSLYWESRPFFPIDTVFYVKSKRPLTYCHQLLKTLGLNEMNTDAAVPGLNRENVYRLLVLDIPASILKAFDEVAQSLRERIDHNEAQAQTLATLRDTLLPRLISGQLRLPEAQALVESAHV